MKRKYRKSDKLYRPSIKWSRAAIHILTAVVVSMAVTAAVCHISHERGFDDRLGRILRFMGYIYFIPGDKVEYKVFLLALSVTASIRFKKILIFLVHVYQRYAPDEIRLACRFTPSCSQYMILAIEKYGVVRGVAKGLCRLSRCRAPNGGEDYP